MLPTVAIRTPQRFRELKHMIGNTPLLEIRFSFQGESRLIYAKAEHMNMTGSIKDRMAFHILKRAYQESAIDPRHTIAEATSGNTGISFAAIGRALGHQVMIFMPDWMSPERVALIKSLGATVRLVTREEGGFLGSIEMANNLAESKADVFSPVTVFEQCQRCRPRGDYWPRNLVAAKVTILSARRICGGRRDGWHGNGCRKIPANTQSCDSPASTGTGRVAHPIDRLQGGSTPDSGNIG